MGVLQKIRGLWRFDGDDEPIVVTRRSFLFLGGMATAGALLRRHDIEEEMSTEDANALFHSVYKNVSVKLYDAPSLEAMLPYYHNPNAPDWAGIERALEIAPSTPPLRIRERRGPLRAW